MKNIFILGAIFLINSLIAMEKSEERNWYIKGQVKHDKGIKCCTFIPETNSVLISDFEYKQVVLKKLNKEEKDIVLPHRGNFCNPIVHLNGKYILTCSEYNPVLYDETGKQIRIYENSSDKKFDYRLQILNLDNRNQRVHTITFGGKSMIFDFETGQKIVESSVGNCVQVAQFFPHDGRLLFISHSAHHKTKLWDARSNELVEYKIPHLKKVSIHPEGTYIACFEFNDSESPHIYDLRKNDKNHGVYLVDSEQASSVKFNTTGNHILTKYKGTGVRVWDMEKIISCFISKEYPESSSKIEKNLYSASFHPKEDHILTSQCSRSYPENSSISIWDLQGNELETIACEQRVLRAKYDKTGDYIVSKHADDSVIIWEKD